MASLKALKALSQPKQKTKAVQIIGSEAERKRREEQLQEEKVRPGGARRSTTAAALAAWWLPGSPVGCGRCGGRSRASCAPASLADAMFRCCCRP